VGGAVGGARTRLLVVLAVLAGLLVGGPLLPRTSAATTTGALRHAVVAAVAPAGVSATLRGPSRGGSSRLADPRPDGAVLTSAAPVLSGGGAPGPAVLAASAAGPCCPVLLLGQLARPPDHVPARPTSPRHGRAPPLSAGT